MSNPLRIVTAFALATSAVLASTVAVRADVDATGRWLLRSEFDDVAVSDWVQSGTTLTTSTGFSGTIDPNTGEFSMSQPSNTMGACPDDTRVGTVAADSRTLTGTDTFHAITPTLCMFGFSIAFTGSKCGGGLIESGEDCDDGNDVSGDGCSAICEVEGCYECSGEPSVCTLTPNCAACTPEPSCRGADKSLLVIVDGDPERDKLMWKWIRGDSTSLAEFADPLSSASYELCVFAGTASAVIGSAVVAPDAQKWRTIGNTSYMYEDDDGLQDGVRKILLKSSEDERAKIILKGKGPNLPDPHPPLPLPITVQLRNTDSNVCWSASYDAADINRTGKLKAKTLLP